jgi:hypothetical protein
VKRIRLLGEPGKQVTVHTPLGAYTVLITSTRHGWGNDDPNTYCIAAMPDIGRTSIHLSPSRQQRQQVVQDWNDGFGTDACEAAEEQQGVPGLILRCLVRAGAAEFLPPRESVPDATPSASSASAAT